MKYETVFCGYCSLHSPAVPPFLPTSPINTLLPNVETTIWKL